MTQRRHRWGSGAVALMLGALAGCSSSSERPQTKSFSWNVAAPCPLPRFEAMGAVVGGELWVMGGFVSTELNVTRRIDIYDPVSNSWRLGPELPEAETHAAVVKLNAGDDFLLAGGFVGNVLSRVTTAGVWRWNAASKVFVAAPALPSPRAAVAAALLDDGLHVAAGLGTDGESDLAEHLVLKPAFDSAWTEAAPLPVPRNHGAGAASGGVFYAIAGRHGWDELTGDEPLLDGFEPAQGAWQPRAPMPLGRSEIGAATLVLGDGRLLSVGGSIPGQLPSADVLLYDPRSDAWSELPVLPQAMKGVVAARVGDELIVTTGSPTSIDPAATTYVGCCL
jgi:N-acetylneuraminic acid mutarotase